MTIQATYYVTKITTNEKGGETASGHMEVTNKDNDSGFIVESVETGGLAGGGRPHSSKPAPFGSYDILEHTHPDDYYVGDKLYHRIEAQDANYGDDKVSFEGQAEREKLRFHYSGGGATYGCISIPDEGAEKILNELNNTSTETVVVKSKSRNPFNWKEKQTKYGELHIVDARGCGEEG